MSQLQPLIPPKIGKGVLEHVTEALKSDHWLDVDYRNLQGSTSDGKRVMPLALVQQGARMFLVCRFQGYDDHRHLALHRIRHAVSTGLPFDRPEFDLATYVHDGHFGFGHGERIQLRVEIDALVADLLTETPLSTDQKIVPAAKGRFELSSTVVRSEQLRWWLRTYGAAVRVLEPVGLLD